MRKLFTVFVVVLLITGIAIGCGGGDKDDDITTDTDNIDEPVAEVITDSKFPNIIEKADYQIEYPDDWEITEMSDTVTLKPGDNDIVEIEISQMVMPGLSSGDVDELIDATKGEMGDNEFGFEFAEIKFNGYNTMKMSASMLGINIETYNIPMDGLFFIVSASFDDDSKEIVSEVLSTFKLSSAPTTYNEDIKNENEPVVINSAITDTSSTLPNTFNGETYTIGYANDWKLTEESDNIVLKPDDDNIFTTEVTVSSMDMPGLSSGDVDELIEETKKQMGEGGDLGFEFEKIKFNGYDAMKMSMSIMGINIETYNIPMDGVFVIVTANFDDETKDSVFEILDTFRLK